MVIGLLGGANINVSAMTISEASKASTVKIPSVKSLNNLSKRDPVYSKKINLKAKKSTQTCIKFKLTKPSIIYFQFEYPDKKKSTTEIEFVREDGSRLIADSKLSNANYYMNFFNQSEGTIFYIKLKTTATKNVSGNLKVRCAALPYSVISQNLQLKKTKVNTQNTATIQFNELFDNKCIYSIIHEGKMFSYTRKNWVNTSVVNNKDENYHIYFQFYLTDSSNRLGIKSKLATFNPTTLSAKKIAKPSIITYNSGANSVVVKSQANTKIRICHKGKYYYGTTNKNGVVRIYLNKTTLSVGDKIKAKVYDDFKTSNTATVTVKNKKLTIKTIITFYDENGNYSDTITKKLTNKDITIKY